MACIKLVTVDIMNTIIRVLGGPGRQYANVASLYGVHVQEGKLNSSFRKVWKSQNLKYPNFGVNDSISSYKWWTDLVVECFTDAGCQDTGVLPQISTHLYKHFQAGQGCEVIPGASQVLAEIKQKGVKLGVVSNFDKRLEPILMALALRHHFDFVLASEVVRMAKPDPAIFKKTLEIAGVEPRESIHIGDDVSNDYHCPRAAGMTAVLVLPEGSDVPEDVDCKFVVNNITEVIKFIS